AHRAGRARGRGCRRGTARRTGGVPGRALDHRARVPARGRRGAGQAPAGARTDGRRRGRCAPGVSHRRDPRTLRRPGRQVAEAIMKTREILQPELVRTTVMPRPRRSPSVAVFNEPTVPHPTIERLEVTAPRPAFEMLEPTTVWDREELQAPVNGSPPAL